MAYELRLEKNERNLKILQNLSLTVSEMSLIIDYKTIAPV